MAALKPAHQPGDLAQASLARYDAATVRGFHSNWSPTVEAADQELFRDIGMLRARSYEIAMNNPFVKAATRAVQSYVVGEGFRVIAQKPEYEAIWHNWAANAGYDGVSSLTDVCCKIVGAQIMGGDALVLHTSDDTDGISFRLDVIAPERVLSTKDSNSTNGVVRDARGGRIKGYHVARGEPNKAQKKEDLYYFPRTRAGILNAELLISPECVTRVVQTRGVPLVTQSLLRFEALHQYIKNTLEAAYLRASIPAAIESSDTIGMAQRLTGSADRAPMVGQLDGVKALLLSPGDKINWGPIASVDPNFAAYIRTELVECMSVYPIPYQVAVQDYEASTFAGARAIFSDAWTKCQPWRNQIIQRVLIPAYRAVIKEAALLGYIPEPTEADLAVSFVGRAPDSVRPQDLVTAEKAALDAGITSLQQVCARVGADWRQIIRERIEAEQYEAEIRASTNK